MSEDKLLLSKLLPFLWEARGMDSQGLCSVKQGHLDPRGFLWGRKKGLQRPNVPCTKRLFLCFIVVLYLSSFYLIFLAFSFGVHKNYGKFWLLISQ